MRLLTNMILGVAFFAGNLQLQAQQVGLELDTELQTNFKGDYNWVSLLRLNGSIDLSENLTVSAATISIARTAQEPIIDDLQGFSNIEEEPLPLGIAMLGFEYRNRRSTFFLGIKNVNEDYFTSPLTSLFINSSCGIFPTISANYPLANYPLSSWCFHYKAEWDKLTLHTSLYEGRGHRNIAGHDNVFRFSPRRDGMFSITSIEYDNNGSNYSLGCAVYYGVHHSDVALIEETAQTSSSAPSAKSKSLMPASAESLMARSASQEKKSVSATPWLNIEQRLTDATSLMLQASYSTTDINCRYYLGLGGEYRLGASRKPRSAPNRQGLWDIFHNDSSADTHPDDSCSTNPDGTCSGSSETPRRGLFSDTRLGLFVDYAKYRDCSEIAAELTCRIQLTSIIAVQPTLELIRTGRHTNLIGIARLSLTL